MLPLRVSLPRLHSRTVRALSRSQRLSCGSNQGNRESIYVSIAWRYAWEVESLRLRVGGSNRGLSTSSLAAHRIVLPVGASRRGRDYPTALRWNSRGFVQHPPRLSRGFQTAVCSRAASVPRPQIAAQGAALRRRSPSARHKAAPAPYNL